VPFGAVTIILIRLLPDFKFSLPVISTFAFSFSGIANSLRAVTVFETSILYSVILLSNTGVSKPSCIAKVSKLVLASEKSEVFVTFIIYSLV